MAGSMLRFGALIAPFHPPAATPSLAIARDHETVQLV